MQTYNGFFPCEAESIPMWKIRNGIDQTRNALLDSIEPKHIHSCAKISGYFSVNRNGLAHRVRFSFVPRKVRISRMIAPDLHTIQPVISIIMRFKIYFCDLSDEQIRFFYEDPYGARLFENGRQVRIMHDGLSDKLSRKTKDDDGAFFDMYLVENSENFEWHRWPFYF